MKKLIAVFVMFVAMSSICFATTTSDKRIKNGNIQIYYHTSGGVGDFNDSNTTALATNVCSAFYGDTLSIIIDPNGDDASFDIVLYVDPYEIGETQVKKLYIVKTFSALNAATDYFFYVITSTDSAANIFGGIPLTGDLYIGRQNITNTAAAMNDLKIYINGTAN